MKLPFPVPVGSRTLLAATCARCHELKPGDHFEHAPNRGEHEMTTCTDRQFHTAHLTVLGHLAYGTPFRLWRVIPVRWQTRRCRWARMAASLGR